MSRIGKKGIEIPQGVTAEFSAGVFKAKGALGEISKQIGNEVQVQIKDNQIVVEPTKEHEDSEVLWGTYTSHIKNIIEGVSKGYSKKLIVEGIGYKVELKGNKLVFALGFSHPVEVELPNGIKAVIEKNVISLSGIDKEAIGGFSAYLRSLKEPEPYKGKGIKYEGEVIKIKQGKKAVA